MRKLTVILLTLLCLFALLSVSASAASDPSSCTDHDFTGGVCSLCGYSVLGSEWLAPDFAEGDYTMVAVPDTQRMVSFWPEEYYKQMQWIADNKAELNIQAVLHMGDMVENNTDNEWSVCKTGTDILDAAGIPWMPMRGNHDASDYFNRYYNYGSYGSGRSWFGGSYEEGKLDQCYWFVNAGGREYLILNLGWAPDYLVLAWAQGIVEANPGKNVIICCHAYMNSDGTPLSWDTDLSPELRNELVANLPEGISPELAMSFIPDGEAIWNAFAKYENVVLATSGHVHSPDVVRCTAKNGAGKDVSSLLLDRQNDDNLNHYGMVALLSFHEGSDTVELNWYSTRYDALYKANNQFAINVPHVVAKESHTHSHTAAVTAPTCDEKGYTTYTCACGDSYMDNYTDALGHKWDEGKVNDEGGITYTCTVCRIGMTASAPEHTHLYVPVVTAPGCTEQGSTTYICSCGDSYVDDFVNPVGHKFSQWVQTVAPTEFEAGEERCECTACGRVETRAVPATGHVYTSKVVEPSCKKEGRTVYTCACGHSYEEKGAAALGHDYKGKITLPTCTEGGYTVYSCTRCDASFRVTDQGPSGHKWDKWISDVYEHWHVCVNCDEVGDRSEHDYSEWKRDGLGTESRRCDGCKFKETRKIKGEELDNPFMDVKDGDYYFDAVNWALSLDITTGVDTEHFAPNAACTRAQVVTFLWRSMGSPNPKSSKNPFTDVSEDSYYYKAVLWALENDITTGLSEDRFGADEVCTRAQVATFLYRASKDQTVGDSKNPFKDVSTKSYYHTPVLWAVERGITNGVSKDAFGPGQTCTRGQIVTFLYRAVGE